MKPPPTLAGALLLLGLTGCSVFAKSDAPPPVLTVGDGSPDVSSVVGQVLLGNGGRFSERLRVGGVNVFTVKGRWSTAHRGSEFIATQRVGGKQVSTRARLVGSDVYLTSATFGGPIAGCWLRTDREGIESFAGQDGGAVTGVVPAASVLADAATVPSGETEVATQLSAKHVFSLLPITMRPIDFDPKGTVPAQLRLRGKATVQVEVRGAELVGVAQFTSDVRGQLAATTVFVELTPGKGAQPVVRPPADRLMSAADFRAGRCG